MQNDSTNNLHPPTKNHLPKPALPPKPAPPIKVTPPPPPRQSAFHTQMMSQAENAPVESRPVYAEYGRGENADENANNSELESRLTGLDFKEKNEGKKYYTRSNVDITIDLIDSNANSVRGMININTRLM